MELLGFFIIVGSVLVVYNLMVWKENEIDIKREKKEWE
jgi:hypothetical protein